MSSKVYPKFILTKKFHSSSKSYPEFIRRYHASSKIYPEFIRRFHASSEIYPKFIRTKKFHSSSKIYPEVYPEIAKFHSFILMHKRVEA